MKTPCQGEKENRNDVEGAMRDAACASWKRRKGLILVVAGALLYIAGSIMPGMYDNWGNPGSFLNNPKALAVLIAIILIAPIAAIYSELTKRVRVARFLAIILLVYSIILTVIGSIFILAWTIALISKEFRFAPGLYFMYLGIIMLLAGSIMHFRRVRKPVG